MTNHASTDGPQPLQNQTDDRLLLLGEGDNVFVLRRPVQAGETLRIGGQAVTVPRGLGIGHKIARCAVQRGAQLIKYGAPIGRASTDIRIGDHVHLHNLESEYTPTHSLEGQP